MSVTITFNSFVKTRQYQINSMSNEVNVSMSERECKIVYEINNNLNLHKNNIILINRVPQHPQVNICIIPS